MGKFQNDLLEAIGKQGKGDIADAIGMPDQQDYEVLVRIIQTYNKRWPGFLDAHMKIVRQEFISGRYGTNFLRTGQAEVNKASHGRFAVDIPANLGYAIEMIFPSMFKSKKHLRWFTRKFPELSVSGKSL